jgi:hypothetical protein
MSGKQPKPTASSNKSKSPGTSRPAPSSSDRVLSSRISSTPSSPKTGKAVSKAPQAPTSTPTSAPQSSDAATRLNAVRSYWERVAGAVAMTSVFETLERTTQNLHSLDRSLAEIRARGYRFGRDWETQLSTLNGRWPQQHAQAAQLLENERRVLSTASRDVESLLQRAGRDAALITTAESRIRDLQNNTGAAERRIRNTFEGTQSQAQALQQEINRAKSLLDALDSASFDLLPEEHGIAVCGATWTTDQQQPEGLLFLTDARLVFEQRQEVAKKKVLFITTEKELIQQKLWESPIGAVEELETEDKKAFLRRQEFLTLRFSERTRDLPSDVTLQLKGADNDTWRTLIRRAKSGQMDVERFGAPPPDQSLAAQIDQETVAPAKELPTVCPNCAARLPAVFKGMKQVSCDYCGTTVNI